MAIKDHYRNTGTARPNPTFRHIAAAWDLAIESLYAEYETELNIQEIVHKSLQTILCEDQEAGIVASQDISSTQPVVERQKTFVAAIIPLYTELNDRVRDYWTFKGQDPEFFPVFVDAKTILSDFESIISATERGEAVDISESEDSWFFQVAVDSICDDFRIKRERYLAKIEDRRSSPFNRKNKDNPGRPKSVVRDAMKKLATKINYPPRCKDDQFIDLIQEHYSDIRDLIKKPKTGDNQIFPKDSSGPKKLSTAKNYLLLASKK